MPSDAQLDTLAAATRAMLRTVGPRTEGVVTSDDQATFRKEADAEQIWECPVCNWQTTERWRYTVHLRTNPRWCAELGAKRAKAWGDKT